MYQPSPSRQRFIDRLPEQVWSPFLRRYTRWSEQQIAVVITYLREPTLTQREVAERVGCSQGSVSKTLALMKRLGNLVVRTTRGRFGRTIVRLRDGVHRRMIPPRSPVETLVRDRGSAVESFSRGGPPRSLADVLRGTA